MTGGRYDHDSDGMGSPRRWWEKQRFVIPIAVAVLAPAVYLIAGVVAGDGAASTSESSLLRTGRDTAVSSADAAQAPGTNGGSTSGGDPGVGESQAPAVCRRILALREEFAMRGVNPLEVYRDMLEIQRQADGTAVAAKADDAVRTMEAFVSGETDTGAVVAAGHALVSVC